MEALNAAYFTGFALIGYSHDGYFGAGVMLLLAVFLLALGVLFS